MSERQDYLTTMLKRIGGAWGWVLAFGLIGIAAGLCMLFFTGQALYVIAIVFGAWLVWSGVFRFVSAFSFTGDGWLRALTALMAAISIALGVYLLAHPVLSVLVLTITVGFFWLVSGLSSSCSGSTSAGCHIAAGQLSAVCLVSPLASPSSSTRASPYSRWRCSSPSGCSRTDSRWSSQRSSCGQKPPVSEQCFSLGTAEGNLLAPRTAS